jgi:TetR/AcrR family tetracycline transcriptional repressor
MPRPQTYSHEEFVDAALNIVDKDGANALTLRRLGAEMGISSTAVYTYFKSRDELITALVERMSEEIVDGIKATGTSPREVLLAIGISARRALAKRPLLIPAFASGSTGGGDGSRTAMTSIIAMFEQAGLRGEELTSAYRAFENYVLGSTIFDYGAAPRHLDIRRERYKQTGHPDFVAVAKSTKSMAAHNDDAFMAGLERLLEAFGI